MIKRIVILAVCMAPVMALADPPSSGRNGRDRRPMGPPKWPTTRPFDAEKEFEKALEFFERMSPSRFRAYQSLEDDRKRIFRDRIIAFYRTNVWITWENGDEMRGVRQRLLRAEDEVFEVRWRILAAGGPNKASEEDLAELREAVGQLVTVQLKERSLRLDRFKKFVKQEEGTLADILANPDGEIEKRYKDELEGRGVGLFDHPRRHDGPGGRDDKPGDKEKRSRDKDK